MTINFKAPEIKELQPRLLVLGVGGAGGNAINEMIENNLQGVEFIAVNTDAQDLKHSKAKQKIQIGLKRMRTIMLLLDWNVVFLVKHKLEKECGLPQIEWQIC